jgi:predicted lipid-binding transport protein (Tim44 family)
MKRSLSIALVLALGLSSLLWVADADARAGRGGFGGSRGSRSYSAPVRPSPGQPQVSPGRPGATQNPAAAASTPQRPGWGGMLGGALGGLLLGGLLGSLLFGMGGLGHGLFGGLGLLELVIIGALVYFAFSWMRKRQPRPQLAGAPGYASEYRGAALEPVDRSVPVDRPVPVATLEPPAEVADLERGIGHIRQLDASFDPAAFAETATDVFFKVQAAWTTREMAGVGDLVTPEMQGLLQRQCDELRAQRRINRLENIAVRQAVVTEAWQEKGQDYVTVYFLASLLDFTTDESGRVIEGNPSDPVKFEEYWTFARPVGANRFKLTAIQQAS